ncbi:hypothetical protein WME89_26405 [Sorangium sp. So ce321]|uniref:hypothetical protein n=1 Tax=Sorangium sp. So ce321 TaxID=3133300 RepID=UPI003F5F2289
MRIVWLAAADARGHLMRAHLARRLLARVGVRVTLVTTSEEGRAFLAALGAPSEVLSCHYSVAFDARQNMARAATEACVLRYIVTPSRGPRDLARLSALCRGASYVVNDFHPLLLLAGARGNGGAHALPCPVVHVHGENLWRAIEGNFHGRCPALVDRGYGALVRALRDRAHARIEHTFDAPFAGDRDPSRRSYRLLPLIAAPGRSAAEVRAELGVGADRRLAAVYLNPHFADPALATALATALAAEGYVVHGVAEGLARHPCFRPYDARFADVAAAADLLVSAPGMGAVGMARLFGVPFLALLTDQPEQRENVRFLSSSPGTPAASGAAFATVELAAPGALACRLREAAAELAARGPRALDRPSPAAVVSAIHGVWTDVLAGLAPSVPPARPARFVSNKPSNKTATQEVHP